MIEVLSILEFLSNPYAFLTLCFFTLILLVAVVRTFGKHDD